jgi:hypothetical protein
VLSCDFLSLSDPVPPTGREQLLKLRENRNTAAEKKQYSMQPNLLCRLNDLSAPGQRTTLTKMASLIENAETMPTANRSPRGPHLRPLLV